MNIYIIERKDFKVGEIHTMMIVEADEEKMRKTACDHDWQMPQKIWLEAEHRLIGIAAVNTKPGVKIVSTAGIDSVVPKED